MYINDYRPANYFPVGIAYIFFQISPAGDLGALGIRVMALAVSFSLLLLFLLIYTIVFTDYPAQEKAVAGGFENCRQQLLHAGEDAVCRRQLQGNLHKISVRCCTDLWECNRSALRPGNKINYYCRYIVFFITFNHLMNDSDGNSDYGQAKKLYEKYWDDFQNRKPEAVYRRLHFRMERLDMHNFRIRFALREVIVLVPCMIFARISGLENIYWMVLCAFFLITPYSDLSTDKVKRRIIGTIVGVILCRIAFPLLPTFTGRAVLMTVANFFSFFGGGYDVAVICITCAVTALSRINGAVSPMLLQRLIYNLLGALIAVFANRFIFPVHTADYLSCAAEYADRLRDEIMAFVREIQREDHRDRPEPATLKRDEDIRKETDQRMISLLLLQERMEELDATLPEAEYQRDISDKCRRNIMEIAQIFAGGTPDAEDAEAPST